MAIPHDQIDPDALKVVRRLTRSGFDAYLVGGCVRDLLLGRRPKDFDVATSATPNEIRATFRNCRIIGRRFRLAHIFFGQKIIETSTFRANPREVEGEGDLEAAPTGGGASLSDEEIYIRRDNVFGTAEEDARRRDFTINGLFYDVEAERVIDYVEGLPDLERRMVRTIGDPDIRFREDPVRILRAIKFAARLDFTIEEQAWQMVLRHRGEIGKCAPARVVEEIYRLLRGGEARRSIEFLEATGVLEVLAPPLAHRLTWDEEARSELYRAATMLDVYVARGNTPSNALLLGVLTAPLAADILYVPDDGRDPTQPLLDRVQDILTAVRASRRDTEIVRQLLIAQRRIGPSKRGPGGSRRGRAHALARRDWFPEALALYEMVHPDAIEPGTEAHAEVARWRRLMAEASGQRADRAVDPFVVPAHGPPTEPSTAQLVAGTTPDESPEGRTPASAITAADRPEGPEGQRRRRRRRGGRRRREAALRATQGGMGALEGRPPLPDDPTTPADVAGAAAPGTAAADHDDGDGDDDTDDDGRAAERVEVAAGGEPNGGDYSLE
jgi:poly(A) polymerase